MKILIAICDDDKAVASELEISVEKILTELSHVHDIEVYLSSSELMEAIDAKQCFDLIFLDIQFSKDEIDGVEVGTIIRKTYDSNDLSIVFISREQGYAMRLFGLQPLHFLKKPLEYAKIGEVIRMYLQHRGKRFTHIEYTFNKNIYKVYAKDVIYVESYDRKLILHLNGGVPQEFNGSLKTLYNEQLKKLDFLLISSSITVNYDFIEAYLYDSVKLRNIIEVFSVSQPRRKDVREAYHAIRLRKGI